MATEMTVEVIRRMCKEKDLYRTPHLNEKLYLHFMGFEHIRNLEAYVNLKAIFLEGNALQSLAGLAPHCAQLRCVFAQQNCLLDLEGLEGLDELDTLNVSNNAIKTIARLECLPKLSTLQITHNRLARCEDLLNLTLCPTLTVLDLSHNQIDDEEVGPRVLFRLPRLACLYLQGNPVVGRVRHYRKTMVVNIRTLNYLDDRPVFPKERRLCDAWHAGGVEAERSERAAIREEEEQRDKENFEYLRMIRDKAMAMRTGMRGDGSEDDEDDEDEDDDDDEDDYEEPPEPPELVAARLKLASYPREEGVEEPEELTRARMQLGASASGPGGGAQQQQQTQAEGAGGDNRERISGILDAFAGGGAAAEPAPHADAGAAPEAVPELEVIGDDDLEDID